MTSIHFAARARNSAPPHSTTGPTGHRARPTCRPLDGPLFDPRFRRLIDHLHRLGPKPLSELLRELVGTDDGLQADTLFLLEKYGALDPEIVRALGADTFPPSIFPVGAT